MLSEMSDRETLYDITYMWNLKYIINWWIESKKAAASQIYLFDFFKPLSWVLLKQTTTSKVHWNKHRDFPGGPVIKTSLSNGDGGSSVPQRELRFPDASWPKNRIIKQKQYCNRFSKHLQTQQPKPLKCEKHRSVKRWDDYTSLSVARISQS